MRRSTVGVVAVLAGLVPAASPAAAATNPGTGDPGFFTFRPDPDAEATVNVASGNLLLRARDLADSARTAHVVVDRFYNSRADPEWSLLGPGWGLDVGPRTAVAEVGGRVVVTGPSGYRVAMTRRPDGTYLAPLGFDGTLLRTAPGWTLQRRSRGDAFEFSRDGSLEATRDAGGRRFAVEYVDVRDRTLLSSYGSGSGPRARFCYRGDGLVRSFDDPASARHRYSYSAGSPAPRSGETGAHAVDDGHSPRSDTAAHDPKRCTRSPHERGHGAGGSRDPRRVRRLKRVADEHGTRATYGYDEDGFLSSIRLASGAQFDVEYSADGRVQSFVTGAEADRRRTRFDYARRPYKTDVLGPAAIRRTYAYDGDWRVTRQYNPDVLPTVHAAGELVDLAGRYHRGDRPVDARVSADEPDGAGLTRLAVDVDDREVAAIDVPCTTTAFDVVCPTTAAGDVSVDLGALAEGRHAMRPAARDDEQHRATGEPWSITIDRTPPPAPENVRLERFGAAAPAVATFGWDVPPDPDLPGGVPGSGVARSEVRYGVNGSVYGGWAASEEDGIDIAEVRQGDVVDLQVRSVDAVGNVSEVATVALEVVERDEDPAVTEIAAEAYVEDYGGDLATARHWMRTQDLANNIDNGDLGDAVSDASPAHYGGIWFDDARRRMVVDLTAGASVEAVEDVIAARGLAGVTDYRTTDYTQRELELAQPPLEDELADLVDAGLVGLARVSSRNAIEIEVASGATAAQRARVDAAATGAPVRVFVTEVAGPTLGDEEQRCRFPDCDLPLRGGVRIVGLQGVECTSGFLARSRSDAKMYLMTAAHCMTDGNTGWVITDTTGLRIGIGINHSVIEHDQGDVGLIAVADRVLHDVRPWVFVTKSKTAGAVQTTRNPHYRITGSSRNREGAYVCFNGRTSGARCGEIEKVNTTFNGHKNMVRVALCSDDGDSGAPFFKGGRAFGVLAGRRRNILRECVGAFYTGARIAEARLNVTISG